MMIAALPTFDVMDPYPFTDSSGRARHVYDYWVAHDCKCALPINDHRAKRRAFVRVAGDGPVMVYEFGRIADHTIQPKLVEFQLAAAKPLGATAGERLDGTGR